MKNALIPLLKDLYETCRRDNNNNFGITLRRGLTVHMKIDTESQDEKVFTIAISREDVAPGVDEWEIVRNAFQYPFRLPEVDLTHKKKHDRYWIKGSWVIHTLDIAEKWEQAQLGLLEDSE